VKCIDDVECIGPGSVEVVSSDGGDSVVVGEVKGSGTTRDSTFSESVEDGLTFEGNSVVAAGGNKEVLDAVKQIWDLNSRSRGKVLLTITQPAQRRRLGVFRVNQRF
jgi:hypothetical protein